MLSVAMVGVSMTAAPTEAHACKSGCYKQTKAKYGMHLLKRHAYKKQRRRLRVPSPSV